MNKGLSNFEIDKFFKYEENEEIKKNYMGVYSMDLITRYINFYEIIKRKNGKYLFAIFNTDEHDKPGMHWWSFMCIHPKKNLFLFDGLRIDGFKFFIVDNDGKIINQLLYDFKKCEPKSNQKLKLCAMKFCVETWQKISHKVKDQPTDTPQNFFYLLAKLKKTEYMNILTLENNVEDLLG